MKDIEIKEAVKSRYSQLALEKKASSICTPGCCSNGVYNIMNEDYSKLDGYNPDADMGLGCGLPTQHANIKKGNTVVDLGSGAGNDCFIAREEVGATGHVIGVDFSAEMISVATENAKKRGFTNIEFRHGDIENMPIASNSVDVVVSNCVLNLLPNKEKIFYEIHRVLKPGGHFCISDIVLKGELPKPLSQAIEMYAGCVAGAILQDAYLHEITKAGFENIEVVKKRDIDIPDDLLLEYLNDDLLEMFKSGESGIFSITVRATKREK